MKKAILYWKTLIWSLFMLFVFLFPANSLSKAPAVPGISQLIHIILFSVFTWLLVKDQIRSGFRKLPAAKTYLKALFFSLLLGAVIEILQNVSGLGRSAEFLDLVYDVSGSILSIIILIFYFRRSKVTVPKY